MKTTGIVRKLNDNGRVVIPMEARKLLGLEKDDSYVEIFTDSDGVYIKKHELECIFCGEKENIITVKGKKICKNCITVLRGM